MNDYMGTGTGQQHCACDTQAGTSNVAASSGSGAYQTGTAATGMTPGLAGYNAGISQGGVIPMQGMSTMPSPSLMPAGSTVMDSTQFLNSYLRAYIGRNVTVQFLFGTDTLTDRTGTLVNVGANYITLREFGTSNLLVCDFFSIKIVRVYQN
ncbi:MAG: hypothetical protein ABF449_09635 [Ethanoligenens sp.]|uniref:hypothetical protein n=1 Tax=Ethanoligenens sp. TaxID=2099655 RepID=UPI0039E7D28B